MTNTVSLHSGVSIFNRHFVLPSFDQICDVKVRRQRFPAESSAFSKLVLDTGLFIDDEDGAIRVDLGRFPLAEERLH